MPRRPALAFALLLAACGSDAGADPDTVPAPTPVPTIAGVGRLPDTVPTLPPEASTTTEPLVVVTRPVDAETGALIQPIAQQVNGNRLLVIGDSIMASTATRFGREMCDELNPMGWTVEVDAEPGRFVEFGQRVLDRRLPTGFDIDPDEDWDAAVVHLGSNYRLDQDAYRDELTRILFQLSPRPTLLFTVTEYRPAWAEVNEVIRELADLFDSVTLIDWEKAARTPGVLSSDGLHPGDAGEEVLVGLTAAALGTIAGVEGECLRSPFTDDSAIRSGGGSPNGSSSSTGGSSSSSSGSSSTGGSTTGGSTTGGSTTGGGSTTTLPGGGTDTTGGTGGTTPTTTLVGGGTDTTTGGTDTTTGGTDTTTGGTDTTTGGTDTTTGGTDTTTGGTDTTTGGTDTTTSGSTTGGSTTGSTSGSTTSGSTTGSTSGTTTTGTTSGSTTGGSTTGDTSGSTTGGDTSGSTTGGDTGG